jgi:hypothetical protein
LCACVKVKITNHLILIFNLYFKLIFKDVPDRPIILNARQLPEHTSIEWLIGDTGGLDLTKGVIELSPDFNKDSNIKSTELISQFHWLIFQNNLNQQNKNKLIIMFKLFKGLN